MQTPESKDKPKPYVCNEAGCGKAFYRSEHLARHRLNHRPKKVFACTQCPKEFVRLDLLQRHQKRHEKGMWYRNVGGRVEKPVSPHDPDKSSPSSSLHSAPDLQVTLPQTIDLAEAEGTVHVHPVPAMGVNEPLDFDYLAPVDGANSLFFDDSMDFQDLPDDLDWLFEDASLEMDSMTDNAFQPLTPTSSLHSLIAPPMLSAYPPPIVPISVQSGEWTAVQSRLLSCLNSLPPEILETSFFLPSNLALFYDLYFENYDPHFPILHRPSMSPAEVSPLLMAAIVTLGATMSVETEICDIAERIHDSLRWIVFSSGKFEPPAPLWCLQALLIIQAHAKMRSTRKHHEMAHVFHGAIITMMKRGSAYSTTPASQSDNYTTLERSWHRWVEEESSRRTAFFAFVMDAQHFSLFGHAPVLSANDIRLPLPCVDSLWHSPTPERWNELMARATEPPQFLPTLKALLGKTPVPASCCAYSRFILLHGLLSVITHLLARDVTTLGVGAGKPFSRESSTSSSQIEDWRDILSRAIDTWSFSLLSQSPSLCLEAARPMHRMAYITLFCNIIDFHIVAGAPSLLGSLLSRNDYSKAKARVRSWSEKEDSKKALYHCLLLIQETVFTSRRYHAREDNIALRPWCLYHATLILWAYGFMTEGKTDDIAPPMGAEEYLVRMLSTLSLDKGKIKGANRTKGLITVVRDSLVGCRWELMEEAYVTLGRLIGILPEQV